MFVLVCQNFTIVYFILLVVSPFIIKSIKGSIFFLIISFILVYYSPRQNNDVSQTGMSPTRSLIFNLHTFIHRLDHTLVIDQTHFNVSCHFDFRPTDLDRVNLTAHN